MESLFSKMFEVFSVEYMFTVIMASYFVIKIIDKLNGKKRVSTYLKRIITALVGIVFIYVFKVVANAEISHLFASYFAAIFVYDTAIKYLVKRFGIGYKK